MSACVFHQKLQLLSCCIEQKRKREKDKEEGKEEGKVEDKLAENEDPTVNSTQSASLPKDQDSDDEFYDCPEEMVDVNATDVTKMTPEGRLTQCGTLTLLNSPNEPLYVPIIQDPPPMTEDMMQENSRILSQLGTSAESAALRAKMQCASLLSDMQAFKAANPGLD
jgi:Rab3 GTPase-activating protein catalytic subunit